MFKRTKKGFAIILAVAMLACMIPGTALAANVLDVFSTPTVKDKAVSSLGTVSMELNKSRLDNNGDTATFILPNGFQFVSPYGSGDRSDDDAYNLMTSADWNDKVRIYGSNVIVGGYLDADGDLKGNYVKIPAYTTGFEGNPFFIADEKYDEFGNVYYENPMSPFTFKQLGSNYELEIKLDFFNGDAMGNGLFELHLGEIYVEDGYEGNVSLEITEDGGCFISTSGKTIAVVKSGTVATKSTNAPAITEDGTTYNNLVEFRVTESVLGAIDKVSKALSYKLPNGLEWQKSWEYRDGSLIYDEYPTIEIVSGKIAGYDSSYRFVYKNENTGTTDVQKYNDVTGAWDHSEWNDFISYSSNSREMYLNFDQLSKYVTSDSALKLDIKAGVNVNDSSKLSTGDISIDIGSKGSTDLSETSFVGLSYGEYGLNPKVTKTTTIVAGQLNQDLGEFELNESVAKSLNANRTLNLSLPANCYWTALDTTYTSRGNTLTFNGFNDSGRTAKYKVTNTGDSKKGASFEFKNMQIVAAPDFTGDVVVTFGGSEGLTGEITLATVIAPVSMTVSEAVTVGIGKYAQEIGDVTITENAKEVFRESKDVVLHLPNGVSFSSTPTVKVTAGDLDLDDANTKTANNDQDLNIRIDGQSAKASTITVSDIFITVNRTVAEGNIKLQVQGAGVLPCNDGVYGDVNSVVASYLIDDCGGAIDGTIYTLNNFKGLKLDKDWKMFGSIGTAVEDVIAVCGTPADDSAEKAATLATFTIGSTNYTLNGEDYTMDAAAYISNGRTMLPIRYVAHVLGITEPNIIWDVNLKTVTLSKDGIVVQIAVGSDYMVVNGVKVVIDEDNPGTVAENKDGRVYLPVREICEQYGYSISWDANTQVVTIAQSGTDFETLTETATPTEAATTSSGTVEATPVG